MSLKIVLWTPRRGDARWASRARELSPLAALGASGAFTTSYLASEGKPQAEPEQARAERFLRRFTERFEAAGGGVLIADPHCLREGSWSRRVVRSPRSRFPAGLDDPRRFVRCVASFPREAVALEVAGTFELGRANLEGKGHASPPAAALSLLLGALRGEALALDLRHAVGFRDPSTAGWLAEELRAASLRLIGVKAHGVAQRALRRVAHAEPASAGGRRHGHRHASAGKPRHS